MDKGVNNRMGQETPRTHIGRLLAEQAEQSIPDNLDLWPAIRRRLQTTGVQAPESRTHRQLPQRSRRNLDQVSLDKENDMPRFPQSIPHQMDLLENRSRFRAAMQFIGATAAMVAVALVLVAVFRGDGESDDGSTSTGASPDAATASSTAILPTPDSTGVYQDVTFVQARAIVPYLLVMPDPVPLQLEEPTIRIVTSPPASDGRENHVVRMSFDLKDTVAQPTATPDLMKSIGFTQSMGVFDPTMIGSDAETITAEIGGSDVNKTTATYRSGDPIVIYWWTSDGVQRQVEAVIQGGITEGLVEQLVVAILEASPSPPASD